jgi:hypothetical protein
MASEAKKKRERGSRSGEEEKEMKEKGRRN